MTYTNEQLKAAFFKLLNCYRGVRVLNIGLEQIKSRCECCPLGICSIFFEDDDANACDEEILKWFVEKANERFN